MAHTNGLISFFRHYGPIPAGDNMYDELIQAEIEKHGINPALRINPKRLKEVQENFESPSPQNVILTGTAGDGKTYHCRKVWAYFNGNVETWKEGSKVASLRLPVSGKLLTIVKDLSELTQVEKTQIISGLSKAVQNDAGDTVYLVAANDGQLLASWRDWADSHDEEERQVFKIVENMLVDEHSTNSALKLDLYNLSRLDASKHFEELIEQIVEHPQWAKCNGCELLNDDGTTKCPIRINRDRLRESTGGSVFRNRLGELMKLARANRMHMPIRDLILLGVNILLGDRQGQRILLTCRTAKNRAASSEYRLTNPYANVFGMNLPERHRQQYQIFTTLDAFGIGRETDNKFDNLLIYGKYDHSELYQNYVSLDTYYGAPSYEPYLRDYLEGERENIKEFMHALSRQRQRLFFSLPGESKLDAWRLTVYQASGKFLAFVDGLARGSDVSRTHELLVRGLNRTFCGMMIDDGTVLYLASSGGDGRGRIASLLSYDLPTKPHRREPYLRFRLGNDAVTLCLQIVDPANDDKLVDHLSLQLTHFEYLLRVANGSLPASFSLQCNEDFLDFKLRLIKRLDELIGEDSSTDEVSLKALTVDERGRVHSDNIRIPVNQ